MEGSLSGREFGFGLRNAGCGLCCSVRFNIGNSKLQKYIFGGCKQIFNENMDVIRTQAKYLIGQNNVGQNCRRTKFFVGQNFRHHQKISSLLSDEKF